MGALLKVTKIDAASKPPDDIHALIKDLVELFAKHLDFLVLFGSLSRISALK